jgi:catechol 2,3-dioxygenase-like lactoylglutathione lyase family enzyme
MAPKLEGFAPLVQVFDMPTSVRFYRDLLGFEMVAKSEERSPDDFDWGWLRRDGVDIMLNTAYESDSRPANPNPERIAAHDDLCFYMGCRDLDAAYEYLVGKGVAAKPPTVAPYGMKQLYFKDPDGYGICLQWRVAAEKAEPGS